MVDQDKTNGCLPFSPQTHIMDAPPPQRPMSQACAKTSLPARRPMPRTCANISPPVRRGLSLCPPAGNGAFSHKTNANSHKIPKIIRIRRTFFLVVILCCGRTHGLSPYEHGTGLFPSCTADGHRLKPLRTWNGSFSVCLVPWAHKILQLPLRITVVPLRNGSQSGPEGHLLSYF